MSGLESLSNGKSRGLLALGTGHDTVHPVREKFTDSPWSRNVVSGLFSNPGQSGPASGREGGGRRSPGKPIGPKAGSHGGRKSPPLEAASQARLPRLLSLA